MACEWCQMLWSVWRPCNGLATCRAYITINQRKAYKIYVFSMLYRCILFILETKHKPSQTKYIAYGICIVCGIRDSFILTKAIYMSGICRYCILTIYICWLTQLTLDHLPKFLIWFLFCTLLRSLIMRWCPILPPIYNVCMCVCLCIGSIIHLLSTLIYFCAKCAINSYK